MFRSSRGRWLAALTLTTLAPLTSAQLQGKSANVQFYVPDGRPLPADFFIVRDADGLRVNPASSSDGDSGKTWAFTNVGRKLSFEYTKKGLKYPGFEVILEDAPIVYVSILADPETGQVKYIRQKAQRPQAKPKKTVGIPGRGRSSLLAPPANDACASAIPVFDGLTVFSTVDATTDGAVVPGAQFDGQTYEDIWYLYTPTCNGTLTVSTCNTAAYDTDLVQYEADTDDDGDFDVLDAANITSGVEVALAANDDTGICAPNGTTSVVATAVVADRQYILRVGGFGPGDEGTGTLLVSCGGAPSNDICTAPRSLTCGVSTQANSIAATTALADPSFSCAFGGPTQGDGTLWFKFLATGTSAFLTTTNSIGVTDTLLAVYDGQCGSLVELACNDDIGGGSLLSELCVRGLTIGQEYLVQIASYPGEDLGRLTIDLECPGVCDVPCDDVLQACAIACGGSFTVDNTNATTDPLDPAFSCRFGGPGQGFGTLWFQFVAGATSAKIDTNSSLAFDTLLAVYSGTPGALTELDCSDDANGLLSELCVEGLTSGETYYVQAASFSSFDAGEITVTIECPCGAGFPNDGCESALSLDPLPASVTVDITGATDDIAAPCGVFSGPFQNVWYKVTGTGNELIATTCSAGTQVSDTKISVFCADCGALVCVGGNDDQDTPDDPLLAQCGFDALDSAVSWCSQAGATYLITVGTFSPATAPGIVQLDVSDFGTGPCATELQCLPTGACCLQDGACLTTTAGDCASQGGGYQGDGTNCSSNSVADGGFEAGIQSATWTAFSTNFGTPLCDSLCGSNGGTGPRTGNIFAWFGGVDTFEEGSLEQAVTIPAGATALDFYLEIPVSSGNGMDFLRVEIDGTNVFEAFEGEAPYAGVGYELVSIPLGGFADGGVHALRFESIITGAPALTNFAVDDVSLLVETFPCAQCVTLDFETEDDFTTPLGNGQALSTPPEFGNLVRISSAGANAGPATFDSTPGGPNDPSLNHDMLIGHGNMLLLEDDWHAFAQTNPGFFDVVTDDPHGGDLIFDFLQPVDPQSVLLADINPPPNLGASVTLTDGSGKQRVYAIDPGWTGGYGNAGPHQLDLRTTVPQPGNGTPRFARATEDEGFQQDDVVRMVVHMTGFGALDELVFCTTSGLKRTPISPRSTRR